MPQVKVGDVVIRKSYSGDVFFKVMEIRDDNGQPIAVIKGLDIRLLADAPVSDLEIQDASRIFEFRHMCIQRNMNCVKKIFRERKDSRRGMLSRAEGSEEDFFELPGKVLHLDGDSEYLKKCLTAYKQVEVEAVGFAVEEAEQMRKVVPLLEQYKPDILVLTGHDALLKGAKDFTSMESYRNSRYFLGAVRAARQYDRSKDQLVIFAGACQSHYEALIDAGANFASSPRRIFIHAYDPVFIAQKIAYAPICQQIKLPDLIANTITGKDGVGGIETKGRFRLGYPKSPY